MGSISNRHEMEAGLNFFLLLKQAEELKLATQLTGPVMPIRNVSGHCCRLSSVIDKIGRDKKVCCDRLIRDW